MEELDIKNFIKTWVQASKTNQGKAWIIEQTGLELGDINALKTSLYQKGVQLPPLKKGSEGLLSRFTASELSELIKTELTKK